MSDADWIKDAAMHYQHGDCFDDLASLFSKAYAEHCRSVDHDKLAERMLQTLHDKRMLNDWNATNSEMHDAIAELLAPVLARNAAMEDVLRECRVWIGREILLSKRTELYERIDVLTAKGAGQ